MTKPFSFSWSRLKNFRTCPKRHYHCDLAKDVKEEESTALKWGHEFHEAMAKRISIGQQLPKTMSDRWPGLLRQRLEEGVDVKVELQLAMDEKFQPTPWFDQRTWFRGVVDVLAIDGMGRYAVALDWKTGGKIQPDMEQLALNAQLIFVHENIDTVHTAYQWSQFNDVTLNTYKPEDMVPLWGRLLPEVKKMEQASIDMNYPPKPSGLCIRHCPVTQCPHWGKGSH